MTSPIRSGVWDLCRCLAGDAKRFIGEHPPPFAIALKNLRQFMHSLDLTCFRKLRDGYNLRRPRDFIALPGKVILIEPCGQPRNAGDGDRKEKTAVHRADFTPFWRRG